MDTSEFCYTNAACGGGDVHVWVCVQFCILQFSSVYKLQDVFHTANRHEIRTMNNVDQKQTKKKKKRRRKTIEIEARSTYHTHLRVLTNVVFLYLRTYQSKIVPYCDTPSVCARANCVHLLARAFQFRAICIV